MRYVFVALWIHSFNLHAAYYDVLPKGVRNLAIHFTKTGNIEGSYNSSGNFKGYNINANINADTIKGVNSAVDLYLDSLSTEDYATFSFGTFEGSAKANVDVMGFGGGYGLTDKLTVYGFIPYYNVAIDLGLKRTSKGQSNVGSAIQLENLPDVDARLIQSLFVNYYGYQPLGKWEAKAFGDAEFGFMYQVLKGRAAGVLVSAGAVAPTGRKDNPDILQDIAIGDGQWDLFAEAGLGIKFNERWSFDQWNRLTYQMPSTQTVRLPDSSSFTITSNKGEVKIKLGNKYATNFQGNFNISDEWASSLTYTLEYVGPTDYKSSKLASDKILERDTEQTGHTGKLAFYFSTVSLFKKKKFIAPLTLSVSGQSVFFGKNTPRYERVDMELRLFF